MSLKAYSEQLNKSVGSALCFAQKGESIPLEEGVTCALNSLLTAKKSRKSVYIIGNGGSSAVASHILTDFVNVGKLKAYVLHDSSLMTCMTNDFGYENAYSRILNTVFEEGDLLIAISSSGKSANICNAAKEAEAKGGYVITLSGFADDNPLRKIGNLNFWLDSKHYGMVEVGHLMMLHHFADCLGKHIKEGAHV